VKSAGKSDRKARVERLTKPSRTTYRLPEGVGVKAESLDPKVNAWLTECVAWFAERYGHFAELPRIMVWNDELLDDKSLEPVLGATGSSLGLAMGCDILLTRGVLHDHYPQFFITVFHELHEYRNDGAAHLQHHRESRRPLGTVEVRIELQAREDWKVFCYEHHLEKGGGTILDLEKPKE